jgi:competence protein ComEC
MASAPSIVLRRLQTPLSGLLVRIEDQLERERDQLPLWLPVALGLGIAMWFTLAEAADWAGFMLAALALSLWGFALGWSKRLGRSLALGGILAVAGCGLIWGKSAMVTHDVLARPTIAAITGTITAIEQQPARERTRVMLAVDMPSLPRLMRITLRENDTPAGLSPGAVIAMKARIVPPPPAMLPGGYDFTRAAWFKQIGAVGQSLGKATITKPGPETSSLRKRLSEHVHRQLSGSAGGIAAAFASGDRGGIAPEDEEAMRASGLTHLLSISGLHVTAMVGATIFLSLRLLALSPRLALGWPLVPIAAGIGALAGVGYTLLTGAEVPTIRSCIAALLVLIGISLGREAITLRLVATGALIILILWPESLIGASFQLSFAAITAIVAFHEGGWSKRLLHAREEGWLRSTGRFVLGLMLTGIVVEVALMPIALFHFHKSGLYGALANLIAIPLTTFVIMPLEALALLFDSVGAGAPFWIATGWGLELLLMLARSVAAWPGAIATLPTMPVPAFSLVLSGGLWLLLWKTGWRWAGTLPLAAGLIWSALIPPPDALISGDGRHLGLRGGRGDFALLREKTGDYALSQLSERAGEVEEPLLLDDLPGAQCTADMCVVRLTREGRVWQVGATRSRHFIDWDTMMQLCRNLDIVVSDRKLPNGCTPRWLKLDPPALKATGGLAISLGNPVRIETVVKPGDEHPWVTPQSSSVK